MVIFTLVAIISVTLAMLYHNVSFQGALITVSIVAKFAFEIVLILHFNVTFLKCHTNFDGINYRVLVFPP